VAFNSFIHSGKHGCIGKNDKHMNIESGIIVIQTCLPWQKCISS